MMGVIQRCLALLLVSFFLWRHVSSHPAEAKPTGGVEELQAKTDELSAKIVELEAVRDLQTWANEAISGGHRSALRKLDEYYQNPEIQSLKAFANAEIIRVESYFVMTRRTRATDDSMSTAGICHSPIRRSRSAAENSSHIHWL